MNQTAVQSAVDYDPLSQQHEINILVDTPPQPNLPRPDLFIGTREDYFQIGVPLYDASINCDWEAAKAILDEKPWLVRCSITENCETSLHVAASAKRTKRAEEFVENLVNLMEKDDLELQNKNFYTALCFACMAGNVNIVKIMLKKNPALVSIPINQEMLLCMATLSGDRYMVKYLYENSNKLQDEGWTHQNRSWLFSSCVQNDMFDVALQMAKDCPELSSDGSVLGILAHKRVAFYRRKPTTIQRTIVLVFEAIGLKVIKNPINCEALQLLKIIWKNIAKKPQNEIDDIFRGTADEIKQNEIKPPFGNDGEALQVLKLIHEDMVKVAAESHNIIRRPAAIASERNAKKSYSSRILFVAVEMGNTEFLVELIRLYPDLIWKVNDNNQTIFHVAVEHRNENIYSILYEIGSMKELITPLRDGNGNNMLHLAGKIAKRKRLQDVSGFALQMQRELLWFEDVEAIVPPRCREEKNNDGLKPHELFTKEHKDLVTQAEKWMKYMASQFIVVAALVATIVFAASFTIPGGYNQKDGFPIFYRNRPFIVFVVADAISFFLSVASILMFLNIISSSYAEQDFIESLPKKLMAGLHALFLSIITMTIAFTASFYILYDRRLIWIPTLIGVCAPLSVQGFLYIQYPFILEMNLSTYGSRYLFRPRKPILYYENPKFE